MSKKKTIGGILAFFGCGSLLLLPICAGVGGAGSLLLLSAPMADVEPSELMEYMPIAQQPEDVVAEIEAAAPVVEDLTAPVDYENLNFDSGLLDDVVAEADGLIEDEAIEDAVAEARIVIEEDGGVAITNTRPAPVGTLTSAPPKKKAKPQPEPEAVLIAEPAPVEDVEDEQDFDDIAAEIMDLDSLDSLDDPTPTSTSKKSDKPGTIKVVGDYDRASVVGNDGVYRSPGKHDPGTYRVEITLDDGTQIVETVRLKSGQTVKLRCDVDAGACTR